jgi:hypothetical protein
MSMELSREEVGAPDAVKVGNLAEDDLQTTVIRV